MQKEEMEKATKEQVVLFMDHQDTKFQTDHLPNSIPGEDPIQNLRETRTLRRLSFSKPKSRLIEQNYPSPKPALRPCDTSSSSDEEEEYNEEYEGELMDHIERRKKKRKMSRRVVLEWILFFLILTCLICSLFISTLKMTLVWGLELWKWCVMAMVVFSGRLVSGWVVGLLVFLIERNFMLREKVLYFVYGLRRSFQSCVWLGLVLLSWTIMLNPHLHQKYKMLKRIFRALVAVQIGAVIWLVKIVLVKTLASSFHVDTYFDRMKESVFHHYILESLSGPPLEETAREDERHHSLAESKSLPANWKETGAKNNGSRRIDKEKLRKLSRYLDSRASAWTVKRLVSYVRSSGLSTISKTVDDFGKAESEITSEWEARNCANRVFKNVAKLGAKYIEEEDLMRFLKRVEIHTIFPFFEGALETGRITKSSFRNWVVTAYVERELLAHSLNDTKTAVQQLHKLASAIVCILIGVVFVLVIGLATTNVILFVTSQLLLLGFMFQNTCKTIFESIIFVFVMHPFDIGDRCVIDGVQMVVEEMNILSTVFLRYDMEKIYYPNSVLLTKPISNFRRSPDMCDAISFSIDMSTPLESIAALKKAIQAYVESKPKYWAKHSVLVKEIEDTNKMTLALGLQHTINHQNYGERSIRMSEVLVELKKIFESLGIKYHLPPQELRVTQFNMGNNGVMPFVNSSCGLTPR
ncbi:hypothetical protein NMG60_11000677 [Bertholletia excelsa]